MSWLTMLTREAARRHKECIWQSEALYWYLTGVYMHFVSFITENKCFSLPSVEFSFGKCMCMCIQVLCHVKMFIQCIDRWKISLTKRSDLKWYTLSLHVVLRLPLVMTQSTVCFTRHQCPSSSTVIRYLPHLAFTCKSYRNPPSCCKDGRQQ